MNCNCCGEATDGLFGIMGIKVDDDGTAYPTYDINGSRMQFVPAWCGPCWDRGDCKGPHGGACYKYEGTDTFWDDSFDV